MKKFLATLTILVICNTIHAQEIKIFSTQPHQSGDFLKILEASVDAPSGDTIEITTKKNSKDKNLLILKEDENDVSFHAGSYKYLSDGDTDNITVCLESIGDSWNRLDTIYYTILIKVKRSMFSYDQKYIWLPIKNELIACCPKVDNKSYFIYKKWSTEISFDFKSTGDPVKDAFILWEDSTVYDSLWSIHSRIRMMTSPENWGGFCDKKTNVSFREKNILINFPYLDKKILKSEIKNFSKDQKEEYLSLIDEFKKLKKFLLKSKGVLVIKRTKGDGLVYETFFPFKEIK